MSASAAGQKNGRNLLHGNCELSLAEHMAGVYYERLRPLVESLCYMMRAYYHLQQKKKVLRRQKSWIPSVIFHRFCSTAATACDNEMDLEERNRGKENWEMPEL